MLQTSKNVNEKKSRLDRLLQAIFQITQQDSEKAAVVLRVWSGLSFSLALPHVIMHDELQISAPCIWRGIDICTGEKTTA